MVSSSSSSCDPSTIVVVVGMLRRAVVVMMMRMRLMIMVNVGRRRIQGHWCPDDPLMSRRRHHLVIRQGVLWAMIRFICFVSMTVGRFWVFS